jgi:hypothetical protein
MATSDGIDILGKRVEEFRRIKIVGCLDKLCLLLLVAHHFRESSKHLAHSSHLTGDIHIPHLIAIARLGTTLIRCAVSFQISTIMQAIPYPQSHVLGYQESLGYRLGIIKVSGDVD